MDAQDIKDLTKEAVAISLDNELDYNRMIIDLVTKSPAHFLELIDGDGLALAHKLLKIDPAMYVEMAKKQIAMGLSATVIKSFLAGAQGPQIIGAIKTVREVCGFGLKEAKDIIELFYAEMQKRGLVKHLTPRNFTYNPPGAKEKQVLDYLIDSL